MDWSRLRRHSPNNNGGGFSLVEVIVSVVLLAVSTVAIMSVFNSSISTMRSSTELDATAAAISADLAVIERMNDYYSCPTGSCSVGNLSNAPPNKYEYAPSASDALPPQHFLRCVQTILPTFLSNWSIPSALAPLSRPTTAYPLLPFQEQQSFIPIMESIATFTSWNLITQLAPRTARARRKLVHKYQFSHGAQRHPIPERPLAA